MRSPRRAFGLLLACLATLALLLLPGSLSAIQAGGSPGGQNLRPYGYLFAAYAVAWLLILGWVVYVGRRVGRLSDRLGDRPDR